MTLQRPVPLGPQPEAEPLKVLEVKQEVGEQLTGSFLPLAWSARFGSRYETIRASSTRHDTNIYRVGDSLMLKENSKKENISKVATN